MEVSKRKFDEDAAHLADKCGLQMECDRFNSSFHHLRFLIVMMSSLGTALMFIMRLGMTISIQSMVNHTHLYLESHANATIDDFLAEGYQLGGEFNWNNEIVSIILSWYMIAYTIPQVPSTHLALKIGFQKAMVIALLICSLSLLLTPVAAHLGWQYVVAMRLLNGLGGSPLLALHLRVIESWVRPEEASLALTLGLAVCSLILLSNPIFTGYLSAIHWAYSFYVPALAAVAFCAIWSLVVTDRPEQSRLISRWELEHLMKPAVGPKEGAPATGDSGTGDRLEEKRRQDSGKLAAEPIAGARREPVSWLRIFKVPSFYAHVATWTIYNCTNHGYLFVVPTYLGQFLKIGVADNGLYGTMIAAGCFAPVIWPHLIHRVLLRAGLSETSSRMLQQTVCCLGVALTWIYVGLRHEHQIFAFFLNSCFLTANDVLFPAAMMANFGPAGLSSVAFSIMNSISDILIVPTSTLIGWLLDYTGQSRACWSWLFIGLGLSHALLWAIFVLFTDSKAVEFASKAQRDGVPSKLTDKQQQQQQQQRRHHVAA